MNKTPRPLPCGANDGLWTPPETHTWVDSGDVYVDRLGHMLRHKVGASLLF